MTPSMNRRRALGVVAGAGALLTVGAAEASAAPRSSSRTDRRRSSSSSTRTTAASRTTTGSSSGTGTAGLTARALAVRAEILAAFPRITEVGGVRPDSLPDHPSGHALDFMIPSPTSASGIALGNAIAAHLQNSAGRLGVSYVIWRQRIWNVSRSREGWRDMADRGSATANHMDHVHVTVL